jgi:hypothetical protein
MGIRYVFSPDIIKEFIKKQGYRYYDSKQEYVKNGREDKKKVWFALVDCNKDHDKYWVKFSSFKRGNRCKYCAVEMHSKFLNKWTPTSILNELEKSDYRLIKVIYRERQTDR